jgi:hypothetical protein
MCMSLWGYAARIASPSGSGASNANSRTPIIVGSALDSSHTRRPSGAWMSKRRRPSSLLVASITQPRYRRRSRCVPQRSRHPRTRSDAKTCSRRPRDQTPRSFQQPGESTLQAFVGRGAHIHLVFFSPHDVEFLSLDWLFSINGYEGNGANILLACAER